MNREIELAKALGWKTFQGQNGQWLFATDDKDYFIDFNGYAFQRLLRELAKRSWVLILRYNPYTTNWQCSAPTVLVYAATPEQAVFEAAYAALVGGGEDAVQSS